MHACPSDRTFSRHRTGQTDTPGHARPDLAQANSSPGHGRTHPATESPHVATSSGPVGGDQGEIPTEREGIDAERLEQVTRDIATLSRAALTPMEDHDA